MKKITMLFLATLASTLMWIPANSQTNLQLSTKHATNGGTMKLDNNSANHYRGPGDNNVVIFEQTEGGGNGIVSDYYIPINSGAYSADDFSLNAETDIHLMQFRGFGNATAGLEPVLGGFQLFVYADTGGAPAGYPSGPNPAILELDLNWDAVNGPDAGLSYEKVEETGFFPVYIVTFDIEAAIGNVLTLAAGNYWVVIAAKINGPTSSTRFAWSSSLDANGALPKLSDPQALFGSNESWIDLNVLTSSTNFNALTFTVYGALLPDCNGMPDAGVATVNPVSGSPSATYNVSAQGFSGAPGISFQWQSNTNGAGWIDQGAATMEYGAYTATAPTQIGDQVEWRLASTCVATADTAYSGIATFTVAITYCTVNFPSNVEPITHVSFAGIENTTSAVINGTPALEDFTAQTASVELGNSYPIEIKGNTDGNFTARIVVYIDWNQDGIFDNSTGSVEMYSLPSFINSTGQDAISSQGFITVPATAMLGDTRMRVMKKFSSVPGPCNTAGYGQAEDYTINVSDSTVGIKDNNMLAGSRLFPNPINGDTFYVQAPNLNGERVEVSISDMAGRQIFNNTLDCSDNKVTVSVKNTMTSGVYLVTLKHAGEAQTYRLVKK